MTLWKYEIVQHDGGWAYKAGTTFSETFATHDEALKAAQRAAQEQKVTDETTGIEYEDEKGQWHEEVAEGTDRPETVVEDPDAKATARPGATPRGARKS